LSQLEEQPGLIEGAAQVYPFAGVNEPTRPIGHFLTPNPPGQGVFHVVERLHEIKERLVDAQGVPVDVGARTANPPVLQTGLELAEEAEEGAKVQVGVQHVAL
jgi:hypothetical protein